jgi:hypothetical protein
MRPLFVLLPACCALGGALLFPVSPARSAEELSLLLAKQGPELLQERFEAPGMPSGWTRNFGKVEVAGGALRASQLAGDQHPCAFRRALPLQDAVIRLDFRFEGAKMLHVGFDPTPGELKKKGHLFTVAVSPTSASLQEAADKADPASKNRTLATASVKLENGTWYPLLLEMKGHEVAVQIAGQATLRASTADFACKKPGIVFRTLGPDDAATEFDNLQVWEAR